MGFRFSVLTAMFICLAVLWGTPAKAMSFEVTNIRITAQSTDAVKARELALAQAQRKALSVLIGRDEAELTHITDLDIARLVRGFSVRGERLAARAYTATFTIRFNPNAMIGFVQSNGYDFAYPHHRGPIDANPAATQAAQAQMQQEQGQGNENTDAGQNASAQNPQAPAIVLLPILDIKSQNILWGDPNPWRQLWQQNDYSENGLIVRVPLGDIADVTDVPDAGFLNGAQYNFASLISRYEANNAYIAVVRNQGLDGMLLSLYRHDGKRLVFLRKMIAPTRPGYRFEDTIPAAMKMIAEYHAPQNNAQSSEQGQDINPAMNNQDGNHNDMTGTATAPLSGEVQPVIATIPYQSLQQWVGIQNRLRLVSGVTAIVPMRVSPSNAKIRLMINTPDMATLQRNLSAQKFELQYLPTGEVVLIEQPY